MSVQSPSFGGAGKKAVHVKVCDLIFVERHMTEMKTGGGVFDGHRQQEKTLLPSVASGTFSTKIAESKLK